MTDHTAPAQAETSDAVVPRKVRSRLFLKYAGLFVAVVCLALVTNGVFEIWVSYREHKDGLIQIQHEQAESAAAKIGQFIKEIESQVGWTTQLLWSAGTIEQRRFDALRLLRQVPAITELAQVDASGKEQLRVSRLAMDVVGSGLDLSKEPKFTDAVKSKVYYGPVYFRRDSEPYMTLSLAGTRRDAGVSIAEVNLKLIWDVVSKIKVGQHGDAYVVDKQGRLIAHPDISLVLRKTDMTRLAQVQAARQHETGAATQEVETSTDIQGRQVLTAYAPVEPLGWTVFVELPVAEAYQPLISSLQRTALVLFGALFLAALAGIFLARRMMVPIQALRTGAARIAGGDLTQRISVKTGDELEALADQFNDMTGRLQESYADLEQKVEVRTAELSESLDQQMATSEVLQVISSSPGQLEPVFNAMLENAVRICDAKFGHLWLREGDSLRVGATHGAPEAFAAYLREEPVFRPKLETGLGQLLRTKQLFQLADIGAVPAYGDKLREATIKLAGARSLIGVPMVKDDEVIGAIVIYRQEVRPFTDKQIELVQNFAAQAVIAIENTRLLSELRESLEQQTATSEVLRVISSSPGDLDPVFRVMLENATRICDAKFGNLWLSQDDGFLLAATHGIAAEYHEHHQVGVVAHPGPSLPTARAASTLRAVHVADLREDQAYLDRDRVAVIGVEILKIRTLLAVPMLKDQKAVGAFAIYRQEVRPFTDKQIELVTNFAAQAVIAIENTRLLKELRQRTDDLSESLEQQTATSEVLKVISSSPGELQPVFQTMLENATRICGAKFGVLHRYENGAFHPAAWVGVPQPLAEYYRKLGSFQPPAGSPLDRLLQVGGAIYTADETAESNSSPARLGGARSLVAVPMRKDNELVGAIVIYRQEVLPFSEKQVALLTSFAAQAIIAIENTRLLSELRESLQRQTATSEVLEVISSSPGELEPVFNAMLKNATRICEAKLGSLFLYEGDSFRAVAVHGDSHYADWSRREPVLDMRGSQHKGTPLERLTRTKEILHIPDLRADEGYVSGNLRVKALVESAGARTHLVVPMLKDDELVGAIVVYRQEVRPFSDKQIELITNFAAQAVIAIENTRLLNELRRVVGAADRDLRGTQGHQQFAGRA